MTIVDVLSKELLAIEVGQRLRSEHGVAALNRNDGQRGAPKYLFVDNGSEFSGQLLDIWAYHHQARIDFSRPGKPTDNSHIETFNESFRDECLNLHWFDTLEEAKVISEAWRQDYNESRAHSTLNDLSPSEFVRQTAFQPTPVLINAENSLSEWSGKPKRVKNLTVQTLWGSLKQERFRYEVERIYGAASRPDSILHV